MNRRLAMLATLRDSTEAAHRLRPPADVQHALAVVHAYAAAELDRRQQRRTVTPPEATG